MKYFTPPFEFHEPENDSDPRGPHIVDAAGNSVAMLYWPAHSAEETEAAEQETYSIGYRMATLGGPLPAIGTEKVLHEVWRKRQRQVVVHGWTRLHDDEHVSGELARAAIPYIQGAYAEVLGLTTEELGVFWPWDNAPNLEQPTRELLLNAAALLIAELERLDRVSESSQQGKEPKP